MENFEEDNPEALYIRGLIAEEEDDVESAVQYYTEAAEMYSHPDASYHLGKIFFVDFIFFQKLCHFLFTPLSHLPESCSLECPLPHLSV